MDQMPLETERWRRAMEALAAPPRPRRARYAWLRRLLARGLPAALLLLCLVYAVTTR